MAINSTRGYKFGRTYSPRQVYEAWRARRSAMAQSYRAESTAIRSALATASSNQIEGSAALAANAAVSRIQAMTKAAATVNLSV